MTEDQLRELCLLTGVHRIELAKVANVSHETARRWLAGDNVKGIKKNFQECVSFVCGRFQFTLDKLKEADLLKHFCFVDESEFKNKMKELDRLISSAVEEKEKADQKLRSLQQMQDDFFSLANMQ